MLTLTRATIGFLMGIVLGAMTPGRASGEAAHAGGDLRPNLVLIMADDLGFSDFGCYGGEVRTPNIDRLAREGLRFSQFYNAALCGPSRAALMTGVHPQQVGISSWTGTLNDRAVTLFELLKPAGYATAAMGRLDMTSGGDWFEAANLSRVADRYFGMTGREGPGGNYFKTVRNSRMLRDGVPYAMADGQYKTDLINDYAVDFIRATDAAKPFFLYLSHTAPHWPLHAKPEDIAKYRSLYRRLGWDETRRLRLQRLVQLGLVAPSTVLSPRETRVPPWEQAEHKDWEAERMAVYAAQIDSLDQGIGRVVAALQQRADGRPTWVFVLSDNGASDQGRGEVDRPNQTWRVDGTPTRAGNKPSIMPGPADTFLTAGPAWSGVANTPFRGHKGGNYEGGIASPLIVWQSQGIIKRAGTISHELSHITDVTATVLDLAGVRYPERFPGRNPAPPAGRSLRPVLEGGSRVGHAMLPWSSAGSRAIRQGRWKLVSIRQAPWQLFDLEVDRTERFDRAADQTARVQEMASAFEAWQRSLAAP